MYQPRMHIHTTFMSLPTKSNCLINELKWATQKDVIKCSIHTLHIIV